MLKTLALPADLRQAVVVAILGLQAWTVFEVHAMAIEVAVLEERLSHLTEQMVG